MTTVESLAAEDICTQIKNVFVNGPKTFLDEVMIDFMRGYMKRCGFLYHAGNGGDLCPAEMPRLPNYDEAILYLAERFRECIDIKDQAGFESAFLYLLKAPLPVRQLILNTVIDLRVSESEA